MSPEQNQLIQVTYAREGAAVSLNHTSVNHLFMSEAMGLSAEFILYA